MAELHCFRMKSVSPLIACRRAVAQLSRRLVISLWRLHPSSLATMITTIRSMPPTMQYGAQRLAKFDPTLMQMGTAMELLMQAITWCGDIVSRNHKELLRRAPQYRSLQLHHSVS